MDCLMDKKNPSQTVRDAIVGAYIWAKKATLYDYIWLMTILTGNWCTRRVPSCGLDLQRSPTIAPSFVVTTVLIVPVMGSIVLGRQFIQG
jgi:hypothetical protein